MGAAWSIAARAVLNLPSFGTDRDRLQPLGEELQGVLLSLPSSGTD